MRTLRTLDTPTSTDVLAPLPAGCPALAAHSLTRRGFLTASGLSAVAAALASACGGRGGDGPTSPGTPASGVTYANGVVTIPLTSAAGLAASGGYLITNAGTNNVVDASGRGPNVIVINTGNDTYRAFTSTCTHDNCTVSDFTNSRIHCACHDSYYDATGKNVAGPAPRPLTEYPVQFNAVSRTITITRG